MFQPPNLAAVEYYNLYYHEAETYPNRAYYVHEGGRRLCALEASERESSPIPWLDPPRDFFKFRDKSSVINLICVIHLW